jgi:tripartite-type tricarboxylate transporter receptor subunit TctC
MSNKIKTLLATAFLGIGFSSFAAETITIVNPYGPSHSATPATLRILKEANALQNEFEFVVDYKPGGNQVIAVKQMDTSPTNRLAIIAPAYVENTSNGKLNRADYAPVHALGDACWAVISNKGNEAGGIASLRGEKEIIVGGVGIGNAAHLTSLLAGEKYGFRVKYIVFKSNNDALVNMAGNNGVNFVIDRIESYETFKTANPNLQILAASCPKRLAGVPNVKTLKEQGINAPYIFNITIANRAMPLATRERISKILNDATVKVGEAEINQLSGMSPPVFSKINTDKFYAESIATVEVLLNKFDAIINEAQRGR